MHQKVSLVIPGRNASGTICACLDAVVPLLEIGPLEEVIFVDDGSTDDTLRIVSTYPVKCISGLGTGPGGARNLGWRAATGSIIWFIDSDCVAEPEALERLLPHLDNLEVGGVGGSYGNMRPDSLLACLIHEEIISRHEAMRTEVNFLGSFNVCYRRSVLEEVGGFDEHQVNGPGKPGAEDADLAYRVHRAGHRLHFEPTSRVGHFHPTSLRQYLRSQRIHGYWRVNLHLRHPRTGIGDAYSSMVDHVQPPLAMLILVAALGLFIPGVLPYSGWLVTALLVLMMLAQIPATVRLMRRTGRPRYLAFAGMSFLRSFWRGIGLTAGMIGALRHGRGRMSMKGCSYACR